MEVKKAVVLLGGLGSRFLPLSKVLPKELWPLVDRPVVHYLLQEVKEAGIKEVVFVVPPGENLTLSYLKKDGRLEKILEERGKEDPLKELESIESLKQDLSFSYVMQEEPLGDGHALLQAKEKIGDEPFALLFGDDIIYSEVPALKQLLDLFKSSERPLVALYSVPEEEVSSFGVVKKERIANRFYKIKEIIEKPDPEDAPSNLAVVGKYILLPSMFEFLENPEQIKKAGKMIEETGEIVLAEAIAAALKAGKTFYGYEVKGEWLRCGNKINWLKSHLFLSLKHPRFGGELRRFLREQL